MTFGSVIRVRRVEEQSTMERQLSIIQPENKKEGVKQRNKGRKEEGRKEERRKKDSPSISDNK
jgi:hypothetical protein